MSLAGSQWLSHDASFLLIVAAAFVIAGFVKGVVGLGLPTVAIGLLGIFIPPVQAAALLIVPSFVTNVWQMLQGPALRILFRRLWPLLAGVFGGTIFAPVSLATLDPRAASAGLGTALIVYCALGLGSVRLGVPQRWQRWASPVVGLATGAVAAATGVFVFPAVPYLQGMSLRRDELVQALGLFFMVATLALGIRLAFDGAMRVGAANTAANLVVPLLAVLVGMAIGQGLRGRLSEQLFRRLFLVGLLLAGLQLLVKAFR